MEVSRYLQQSIENPAPRIRESVFVVSLKFPVLVLQSLFDSKTPWLKRAWEGMQIVVVWLVMSGVSWILIHDVAIHTFQPGSIFFSAGTHILVAIILPPMLFSLVFILPLAIFGRYGTWLTDRQKKNVFRRCTTDGATVHFSREAYEKAAEVLRRWNKPLMLQQAVEKYSQESVDICILAGAVSKWKGKFDRLVSIRAIEEDREAGWED